MPRFFHTCFFKNTPSRYHFHVLGIDFEKCISRRLICNFDVMITTYIMNLDNIRHALACTTWHHDLCMSLSHWIWNVVACWNLNWFCLKKKRFEKGWYVTHGLWVTICFFKKIRTESICWLSSIFSIPAASHYMGTSCTLFLDWSSLPPSLKWLGKNATACNNLSWFANLWKKTAGQVARLLENWLGNNVSI